MYGGKWACAAFNNAHLPLIRWSALMTFQASQHAVLQAEWHRRENELNDV